MHLSGVRSSVQKLRYLSNGLTDVSICSPHSTDISAAAARIAEISVEHGGQMR